MKLLKGPVGMAVIGLLLGVGVMVGVVKMFGDSLPLFGKAATEGKHEAAAPAKPAEKEKGGEKGGPVKREGMMVPLKERIVNLADQGVSRYLKTSIVLELADHSGKPLPKGEEYKKAQDELLKEIKPSQPIIEDTIMSILTSKTAAELMSNDGKDKLKTEIKIRLNKALKEEEILSVYFSDFIIQ